jgi:hypothetical protein
MHNDAETADYEMTYEEEIDAENKELCAEGRKLSINIFAALFDFIESGPETKERIFTRAFSMSLGSRISSMIDILERDGPMSVEEKLNISGNIFEIMEELEAIISQFPAISQHLKKEEGRRRAEKARAALPNLSWRNDEIFRRANKALIKKPMLSGKSSAMAHELLNGVNEWLVLERKAPKMKLDALRKLLSNNLEKWKSK